MGHNFKIQYEIATIGSFMGQSMYIKLHAPEIDQLLWWREVPARRSAIGNVDKLALPTAVNIYRGFTLSPSISSLWASTPTNPNFFPNIL